MRAREREALGSQPNSDLEMTVYFSSQLLTTIQKQSFGSPEHSTEFHQAPRLRLGGTFFPEWETGQGGCDVLPVEKQMLTPV